MKRLIIIFPIVLLAACAQYTLVKPGLSDVDGMGIMAAANVWNKVPSMSSVGGNPTWTADGTVLDFVTFFSAIEDGKTLVKAQKKEQYPAFHSNMLPNEIIELVESTISKYYSANIVNRGKLKPLKIDNNPGFEYSFEFTAQDDVPRKAYLAGTIKDKMLYIIFYQATKLYYYDKYFPDIQAMVNNAVIKS